MISALSKYKVGKEIEVRVGGSTYKGILKGMTETELYLKTTMKTWVFPISSIQNLKYIEKPATLKEPQQLGSSQLIPHSPSSDDNSES